MCHVPGQHYLLDPRALQEFFEIGAGEGTGMVLPDDFLAVLGLELGELFGEGSGGCEDWRSVGGDVHDVHEWCGSGAVFFEEG